MIPSVPPECTCNEGKHQRPHLHDCELWKAHISEGDWLAEMSESVRQTGSVVRRC